MDPDKKDINNEEIISSTESESSRDFLDMDEVVSSIDDIEKKYLKEVEEVNESIKTLREKLDALVNDNNVVLVDEIFEKYESDVFFIFDKAISNSISQLKNERQILTQKKNDQTFRQDCKLSKNLESIDKTIKYFHDEMERVTADYGKALAAMNKSNLGSAKNLLKTGIFDIEEKEVKGEKKEKLASSEIDSENENNAINPEVTTSRSEFNATAENKKLFKDINSLDGLFFRIKELGGVKNDKGQMKEAGPLIQKLNNIRSGKKSISTLFKRMDYFNALFKKLLENEKGFSDMLESQEEVLQKYEKKATDAVSEEVKEDADVEDETKLSKKGFNSLENQLGIKFESLKKIEGFGDLSEGQQVLVMNNLKQILSGMNHSEAVSQQAEEFNKKKWLSRRVFGKLWSSITKSLEVASNEKKNLLKIKEDNLAESDSEKPKDYEIIMKQLILGMKKFGPEVDIIDGKTEVRYANLGKEYSDEEKEIVNKFNKNAYSVSRIPKSWLFDDKHKDAYKFRMDRYEQSREELLNMLSDDDKLGPKEAMLKLNNIDASLNINRYLNTNENVEEELLRVKNNRWYKQIASSVLGENGMYFASGAIARTCAVAALGASSVVAPFAGLAAVPVAGGVGLLKGRSRAKKSLLEKDMQAGKKGNKFRERREEENMDKYREERKKYYEKNKESNNFVSGVDLTKKIANHLSKIEEADTEDFSKKHTPEELKIYKIKIIDQLKTRLEYTEKKIDEGLVSFSSPEDELKEMISLYESISKASILIVASELNIDDKMSEISERYLSTKSEIEDLYKSLRLEDFEKNSENVTKIKDLIGANPEIAKVIIANLEGDSSRQKEGEENKKTDIDLMKTELVKYIKDNFREKDKDKDEGEDNLDYKSSDDERLTKMLLKRIRVDSNLESQLKKKAEEIDKARKKYLFKAGVFGAVIAGTSASAGAAIRHFYGEKIVEIAHETTDYLRDFYNEKAPVVIDYWRGVYSEIFGNGSVDDVGIRSASGVKIESTGIDGTTHQPRIRGVEKTRDAVPINRDTGAPNTEPSTPETSLHHDVMHYGKEPSPEVSGDIKLATIKEVQTLENGQKKHDTIIDALTRQLKEKSDQFGYKSSDGDIGKWASAKANNIAANSGYFDGKMDTKVGSAGMQHAAYQLEMDKDGNFTVHEMFKRGDGDFQSIERHGKTIGVAESTGKDLEKYEYSGQNNHPDSLPDAGDKSMASPVNKDIQTNKIKSSLSSNFGKKYFKISNYYDGVDYEFRRVSGNIYEFNALDRLSLDKGGLTDGYIKINSDGSIVDACNYHSLDNQINIDKKFLKPEKTNIPLEERDYNYYKNIKDDLSKIKRAEINNNVLKLIIKGKQYEFKIDSGYEVEIPKDYSYEPFIKITGAGRTIESNVSIDDNGYLISKSFSNKEIKGLYPLNSNNLDKIMEETNLDRAFVEKYNGSYGSLDYNSRVAMMDVRHICEKGHFKDSESIDKMLNGNLGPIINKNYFNLEDLNVNADDGKALYIDFGDGKHIRIYDNGDIEAYNTGDHENSWTPGGRDKKVSDINIKKAFDYLFNGQEKSSGRPTVES